MFQNHFLIAWRNIVKGKMHSLINIVGLSIGMVVAMLIGLWIYDDLSFNKNFEHYDRIAQVKQNLVNNGSVQTWNNQPFPLADELRTNYGKDFMHIVMAADVNDHFLNIDGKKLKVTGGFFEKEMPEMLSLNMIAGTRDLHDPASILLAASTAKAYFGNSNPVNKIITIDQMPPVRVTGVYEDLPHNSSFASLKFVATWDLFYTVNDVKTTDDPWRPNFTTLYVQLNEGADIDAVNARIKDAKLKKVNPELAKKKPALFLHPMSKWHLYSEFKDGKNVGGAIQYVWMFGAIGVFVLLLACINFMNLSTARSEKRAKEVGIRKTMGSLRKQIIGQFFSESLLTVVLAFVLALVAAQTILPFFNELAAKQVGFLWSNLYFWLVCILFIVFTALIAGSYPAFYLSSFDPIKVLKGTFKAGRFAALPRKVLVVVQFTVSVTLIIGTIIVYKQIQFAKDRPVGYNRANLLSVPTYNPAIHEHFQAVKDELLKSGAVVSMAETQSPTTGIWNSTSGFKWPGKDPNQSIDFGVGNVSVDFGKTIDWRIKDGRNFSADFSDSTSVILNEAAVQFMGLKDPVGQVVTWWDDKLTVIGVVENMIIESPYSMPRPIIYTVLDGQGSMALLKLNAGISSRDALSKIASIFTKFDPDQPFEYSFVDDDYAKKFGEEERTAKLAGFFAMLAIVISCLGLFGLTSFVAEQRKKEIGVRKVLGATVFNVWNLLSKEFIVLVSISYLIAVPLAYYIMHGWLEGYTYRTQLSAWIFLVAGAGAMLITLVTVSFQSIKAGLTNPVTSLRSE